VSIFHLPPPSGKYIVDSGMMLRTCWLEVGNQAQARRFEARIADPLRQWKLSSTDLELRRRWYDYSRARNHMLEVTDTAQAPWSLEFLRRALTAGPVPPQAE
jgi:polyphosphate kinase